MAQEEPYTESAADEQGDFGRNVVSHQVGMLDKRLDRVLNQPGRLVLIDGLVLTSQPLQHIAHRELSHYIGCVERRAAARERKSLTAQIDPALGRALAGSLKE